MLNRDEIQTALNASRVVPLAVSNPHGPLGLEHLAEAVRRIRETPEAEIRVERPVSLPVETWEKLDRIAKQLGQRNSRRVTPSEVLATLVLEGVEAIGK